MKNPHEIKAFVTGANGFLGSYLCYYLLSKGVLVKGLKRKTSSTTDFEGVFERMNAQSQRQVSYTAMEWCEGDVLDPACLIQHMTGCDLVYHCAAVVSFDPKKRREMLHTNINGTENVVNACLETKMERLIYISSVAALPNPDKKPILNADFLNSIYFRFNTYYAESKYRSEMAVWRGHGEGLKVFVFNPGIVLGQWKFDDSSVTMFKTIKNGMPFYTSGATGMVDVRDVARLVIEMGNDEANKGKRFIVVGENTSYKDFMVACAEALHAKRPFMKAGLTLSYTVAFFAQLIGMIRRKPAFLSFEVAKTSNRTTHFDATNTKDRWGKEFTSLKETIQWTADYYHYINPKK